MRGYKREPGRPVDTIVDQDAILYTQQRDQDTILYSQQRDQDTILMAPKKIPPIKITVKISPKKITSTSKRPPGVPVPLQEDSSVVDQGQ